MNKLALALAALALLVGGARSTLAVRPALQEDEARFVRQRERLVTELRTQGIGDEAVLEAIGRVPRHEFVPAEVRHLAYANHALPIGHGQTISQPYVVALMSELLDVEDGDRVLEVGTGSGYQAAVLAELGCRVYTIEIVEELASTARERLERLGYEGVEIRHGDGYAGWPDRAPFEGVIVTAAPEEVPEPLIEQLEQGGRMVIPLGPQAGYQYLTLLVKSESGEVRTRRVLPVRFVPFVREEQGPPRDPGGGTGPP